MNDDQPDKCLSAASSCPGGIHLCGGGDPAQQGKAAGEPRPAVLIFAVEKFNQVRARELGKNLP